MNIIIDLFKAAGHKYLKRIPYINARGKRSYRYIYKLHHTHHGKHVLHEDNVQVGTKLMMHSTDGEEHHVEVLKVHPDGTVDYRYDDGPQKGEVVEKVKPSTLLQDFSDHHGAKKTIDAEAEKIKGLIAEGEKRGLSEKMLNRLRGRLERLTLTPPKKTTPKPKKKKKATKKKKAAGGPAGRTLADKYRDQIAEQERFMQAQEAAWASSSATNKKSPETRRQEVARGLKRIETYKKNIEDLEKYAPEPSSHKTKLKAAIIKKHTVTHDSVDYDLHYPKMDAIQAMTGRKPDHVLGMAMLRVHERGAGEADVYNKTLSSTMDELEKSGTLYWMDQVTQSLTEMQATPEWSAERDKRIDSWIQQKKGFPALSSVVDEMLDAVPNKKDKRWNRKLKWGAMNYAYRELLQALKLEDPKNRNNIFKSPYTLRELLEKDFDRQIQIEQKEAGYAMTEHTDAGLKRKFALKQLEHHLTQFCPDLLAFQHDKSRKMQDKGADTYAHPKGAEVSAPPEDNRHPVEKAALGTVRHFYEILNKGYPQHLDGIKVRVDFGKTIRANCSPDALVYTGKGADRKSEVSPSISLPRGGEERKGRDLTHMRRAAAHEAGHIIENHSSGVHSAVWYSYATRIRARRHSPTSYLGENAFDDQFTSHYTGRVYHSSDNMRGKTRSKGGKAAQHFGETYESTEFVSTGVENFVNKEKAAQFAATDPHHFAITYAILRGKFNEYNH